MFSVVSNCHEANVGEIVGTGRDESIFQHSMYLYYVQDYSQLTNDNISHDLMKKYAQQEEAQTPSSDHISM